MTRQIEAMERIAERYRVEASAARTRMMDLAEAGAEDSEVWAADAAMTAARAGEERARMWIESAVRAQV